ncbi:hypothetical protein TNCV_4515941 [Trichonephila clavipes]|nr:hypothetical protein TNCV_4515941 [Trichonephila clavipes]
MHLRAQSHLYRRSKDRIQHPIRKSSKHQEMELFHLYVYTIIHRLGAGLVCRRPSASKVVGSAFGLSWWIFMMQKINSGHVRIVRAQVSSSVEETLIKITSSNWYLPLWCRTKKRYQVPENTLGHNRATGNESRNFIPRSSDKDDARTGIRSSNFHTIPKKYSEPRQI